MVKIEAGDKIQIAGGEWFRVISCALGSGLMFIETGRGFINLNEIDILITDHQKQFDWSTAKSGMCFTYDCPKRVWFVGLDYSNDSLVIVSPDRNLNSESFYLSEKVKLTRHPEEDIKTGEKQ